MKLFEPQVQLTTYGYPITKILICIVVYLLIFFRNSLFSFSHEFVKLALTVLCMLLIGPTIGVIYVSLIELESIYQKRNILKKRPNYHAIKYWTAEKIISLLQQNDIIEIEILFHDSVIKLGASSDCKYSSTVFFDKLYYIESSNFETIEQLKTVLTQYEENGCFGVLTIDGIAPN